eukprot:scaffold1828_cov187-Ochromonas_danica.AAC.1
METTHPNNKPLLSESVTVSTYSMHRCQSVLIQNLKMADHPRLADDRPGISQDIDAHGARVEGN